MQNKDMLLNYSRIFTCATTLKQLRVVSLAAVGFYPSCWRRVHSRQRSITCWSTRLGSWECGRSHGRCFSCCILFAASTVIRCCWEWWFTIVHTIVTISYKISTNIFKNFRNKEKGIYKICFDKVGFIKPEKRTSRIPEVFGVLDTLHFQDSMSEFIRKIFSQSCRPYKMILYMILWFSRPSFKIL